MGAVVRAAGVRAVVFVAAAWLFVACLVVQTFLVGLEVFGELDGSTHRDFAYVYGWLAPILVLLGGLARMPPAIRGMTLVLLVVFAVQTVLPSLRDDAPLLAALHPVNALVIFALAIVVARRATASIRIAMGAPAEPS